VEEEKRFIIIKEKQDYGGGREENNEEHPKGMFYVDFTGYRIDTVRGVPIRSAEETQHPCHLRR
jgi:hypothetical protein